MPRVLAQPAPHLSPFERAVVRGRCLLVIGDLACALQQHDATPSREVLCLACASSVARDISALPAATSRVEMHETSISVLRLTSRAQIAIRRSLRKIK
jgi:hypothetical protein